MTHLSALTAHSSPRVHKLACPSPTPAARPVPPSAAWLSGSCPAISPSPPGHLHREETQGLGPVLHLHSNKSPHKAYSDINKHCPGHGEDTPGSCPATQQFMDITVTFFFLSRADDNHFYFYPPSMIRLVARPVAFVISWHRSAWWEGEREKERRWKSTFTQDTLITSSQCSRTDMDTHKGTHPPLIMGEQYKGHTRTYSTVHGNSFLFVIFNDVTFSPSEFICHRLGLLPGNSDNRCACLGCDEAWLDSR